MIGGERKKLTAEDVMSGELAVRGKWTVACVNSYFGWPTNIQKFPFRGHDLFLIPQFDDFFPSIAVRQDGDIEKFEEAQKLITSFMSALAWMEQRGVTVVHWSGGSSPVPMAGFGVNRGYYMETEYLHLDDLQDIDVAHARWALGFFREGLSIERDLPAYAFLSFYKIINLFARDGRQQKEWINQNADAASNKGFPTKDAAGRLNGIKAQFGDLGQYLYELCRCAVAHAGQGVTVDPEDPKDLKRLHSDLPVIRALAAHAIENVFGIKSSSTIYREHLYELAGFKKVLGDVLVSRLASGEFLKPDEIPDIPILRVGLGRKSPYQALGALKATVESADKGQVLLNCGSPSRTTQMYILLDFPSERLKIDSDIGLASGDDGSLLAAEDAISVFTFKKDHFANGSLEIYNANSGEMLGRCDAFIPVNIDMNATRKNFETIIANIRAKAEQRTAT